MLNVPFNVSVFLLLMIFNSDVPLPGAYLMTTFFAVAVGDVW